MPIAPNRATPLLAAVAGYVDTLGFVALFGLFTAHVTGNFVLIGAELARPGHGVLLKLLAFPAFIAGVVVARLIALVCEGRQSTSQRWLLGTQAVLLIAFMAAGLVAHPAPQSDAPWVLLAGCLGAAAMGVQNATGRLPLAKLTPHTVMTGNVTQLVIDATDVALRRAAPGTRERLRKLLWPVLAFGAGAMAGAAAFMQIGFLALLPAVLVVTWLAVVRIDVEEAALQRAA
ncbi:YoaK family protein [Roseateles sp. NT4]|uniref:YoaK family protein n=1 Tax=Roseateles sp. NT4 TaxID=3453715 RepID=UPI003EE97874